MRVTVVGGGFAGISAAVELSRRGARVTLIESRKRLGGRAYSFLDDVTGHVVDNGQHLLMRCCTATIDLLGHLGTSDRITFQARLDLPFGDSSGTTRLRAPRFLPGRLGLLIGLMKFGAIPWHEAFAAGRITRSLGQEPAEDASVENWLTSARQPPTLITRFWAPLCISVMNQQPRDASARLLASVLREAFGQSADGANVGWATTGLSDLHDPARDYLAARDGSVRLGTMARAVRLGDTPSIELRSGERIASDAIVLAVPPPSLCRLLSDEDFPSLKQRLSSFVPSPIVSVNIWTRDPVLDQPFLGFVDEAFDWVFRRDLMHAGSTAEEGYHACLIASAAGRIVGLSNDRILEHAKAALSGAGLGLGENDISHYSIIREPRATYALPPGVDPVDQRTGVDGMALAGDWTDTGFPCTIEGAIRSGLKATDVVLEGLDATQLGTWRCLR